MSPKIKIHKPPKPEIWSPYKRGLSFSGLSTWLVCRERFRIQYIDNLIAKPEWNEKTDFGTMFHAALEHYGKRKRLADGTKAIQKVSRDFRNKFPSDHEAVDLWAAIANMMFEEYVSRYRNDKFTHLLMEEQFQYVYDTDMGEIILNGIWDAAIGVGENSFRLKENKTKGKIDEDAIVLSLNDDLQTMMYLVTLRDRFPNMNCTGILYDVVRRPAHRRKKQPRESKVNFIARIRSEVKKAPDHFFKRWNVKVSDEDIQRFRDTTLTPILRDFINWYSFIDLAYRNDFDPLDPPDNVQNSIHYRRPFGIYDSLSLGQRGDYFDYITTGDNHNLVPKYES